MKAKTMTRTNFRSAAFAMLAIGAGLAASPAFAQDRFATSSDAGVGSVQQADAEPADVPPNLKGQYTCAFNEVHSHLEGQNCGGTHYRY